MARKIRFGSGIEIKILFAFILFESLYKSYILFDFYEPSMNFDSIHFNVYKRLSYLHVRLGCSIEACLVN